MSKWKKPNRGDRLNIPAETFSLMIDAARAHSEGEGKNLGGGKTRPGSHLVSVENATGGSLDQFSVLEINGVSISPDDNLPEFTAGPILEGIAPTTTCPGKFAVIQQPLTEDEVGRAVVDGVTACKVYVTDNDHEWAEAESGETARLASGTSGSARILWHESIGSGPDTVWAVVALQAAAGGGGGSGVESIQGAFQVGLDPDEGVDTWHYVISDSKRFVGSFNIDTTDVDNVGVRAPLTGKIKKMEVAFHKYSTGSGPSVRAYNRTTSSGTNAPIATPTHNGSVMLVEDSTGLSVTKGDLIFLQARYNDEPFDDINVFCEVTYYITPD
jgi:hypothetical protein